MGLAATQTRIYIQSGVDNSEELKKYQELIKGAPSYLSDSGKSTYTHICGILAKDPNATVEDVNAMFEKITQKHGSSASSHVTNFQYALKRIPGYSSAQLSAEDINNLLDIYESLYDTQTVGSDFTDTFVKLAEQYINNTTNNTTNVGDDAKNRLSDTTNNLNNELQESGNSNETAEPEEPATPEDSTIGADMLGKLNLINLGIRNTFTTFK